MWILVALFLIFWGPSILCSIMAVPIRNHTNSAWSFPFLQIHTSICYLLWYFDNDYSKRCEMISHCGFNLHFTNDYYFLPFQVPVGLSYIFFRVMSIQALCPFLNWFFFSFAVELYVFFINFWYWPFNRYVVWNIFPILQFVFHFVDDFFCCEEGF